MCRFREVGGRSIATNGRVFSRRLGYPVSYGESRVEPFAPGIRLREWSGVCLRTRRLTNWRNGQMALRCAAAAYLDTEKSFRRIIGYRDLWILEAAVGEDQYRE
jgi:hypothetical protein